MRTHLHVFSLQSSLETTNLTNKITRKYRVFTLWKTKNVSGD